MIRINSIDYHGSVSDGPGVRIVLYFQGCEKQCKGCHNPTTWNADKGRLVDEIELFHEIETNSAIKRITISGGEPLNQQTGLLKLLMYLDQANYDIALYTGFTFEEVPDEIKGYLTYLKVGEFDFKKQTTLGYYGSTNQRIYKLRNCQDDK